MPASHNRSRGHPTGSGPVRRRRDRCGCGYAWFIPHVTGRSPHVIIRTALVTFHALRTTHHVSRTTRYATQFVDWGARTTRLSVVRVRLRVRSCRRPACRHARARPLLPSTGLGSPDGRVGPPPTPPGRHAGDAARASVGLFIDAFLCSLDHRTQPPGTSLELDSDDDDCIIIIIYTIWPTTVANDGQYTRTCVHDAVVYTRVFVVVFLRGLRDDIVSNIS